MTRNNKVRDLMAQAAEDLDQGRTELLDALKHIPVSELHNTDPTLFTRLTPEQRAELFTWTLQRSSRTNTVAVRPPSTPYRKPIGALPLLRFWNRTPLTLRSQLVGLFLASMLTAFGTYFLAYADHLPPISVLAEPPSSDMSLWPRCRRLTPGRDGCTYIVTGGLSWEQAAQQLGQDLQDLKAVNRHLSAHQPLRRGNELIVWRNRIPLEN